MSTLHKRIARKHISGIKKENRSGTKRSPSKFLDPSDESRALYYLGLMYHFKGKELLCSTDGTLDDNIRNILQKATVYYEQSLSLLSELNDKVAEGRTLGNLGNVNCLLQDYSTSIEYLDKRLEIAKECNDQEDQRRTHGNLGNAHFHLKDFDKALFHYREALAVGETMNDVAFVARMNFTIGRIYALKEDFETSIYFHEKHLQLTQELIDSIGQCRAYCILSQLYQKLNQIEKANKYENLHKTLAREIDQPLNDTSSISKQSAPTNTSIKNLRTDSISVALSEGGANDSPVLSSHSPFSARSNLSVTSSVTDVRSFAGGSHSLATDDKSFVSNTSKKSKTYSNSLKNNFVQHFGKKSPMQIRKQSRPTDHDELVELIYRMQKSRFEDQRCDLKATSTDSNTDMTTLR